MSGSEQKVSYVRRQYLNPYRKKDASIHKMYRPIHLMDACAACRRQCAIADESMDATGEQILKPGVSKEQLRTHMPA